MRIPRLTFCLLALAVGNLVGCSQTSWLRPNEGSKVKTVATIGDKPLPIVAGEPGSTTSAETEQVDLSPSPGGRISGRVYDDLGKPVPNGGVRLVVGVRRGSGQFRNDRSSRGLHVAGASPRSVLYADRGVPR